MPNHDTALIKVIICGSAVLLTHICASVVQAPWPPFCCTLKSLELLIPDAGHLKY